MLEVGLAERCIRVLDASETTYKPLLICRMVIIMALCFAIGLAMLQALYRWMRRLTLKKEPGGAMLDEHLWALVLQHLDTLQDHVKAATSCKAAWKAGLLNLDVPVHMPTEGMSQSVCIYTDLCVSHRNRTGRVLICPWQHEGQQAVLASVQGLLTKSIL